MICFGTKVFNDQEILYIDLWATERMAKVYFVDSNPVSLDEDATLEARQWAEDRRRTLRLEDERTEIEVKQSRRFLDQQLQNDVRRSRRRQRASSVSENS